MSNKRSIAAGLGLTGATLLAGGNADAATELMQLADSDNRVAIIGLLFLPVIGWVGFNILQVLLAASCSDQQCPATTCVHAPQPALNQFTKMLEDKDDTPRRRRGIAAGLGLTGASLLAGAPSAQAAMELAQVADNDARLGVLAFIFLPALAWVAFNIAGVWL